MKELFISPLFQFGLIIGISFAIGLVAGANLIRERLRRRAVHELLYRGLISANQARLLLVPPSQTRAQEINAARMALRLGQRNCLCRLSDKEGALAVQVRVRPEKEAETGNRHVLGGRAGHGESAETERHRVKKGCHRLGVKGGEVCSVRTEIEVEVRAVVAELDENRVGKRVERLRRLLREVIGGDLRAPAAKDIVLPEDGGLHTVRLRQKLQTQKLGAVIKVRPGCLRVRRLHAQAAELQDEFARRAGNRLGEQAKVLRSIVGNREQDRATGHRLHGRRRTLIHKGKRAERRHRDGTGSAAATTRSTDKGRGAALLYKGIRASLLPLLNRHLGLEPPCQEKDQDDDEEEAKADASAATPISIPTAVAVVTTSTH